MIHILCVVLLLAGVAYAILWFSSRRTYPVAFGVSFSAEHASWLGLEWREAYAAVLDDLRPPYVRLSARWDKREPTRGKMAYGDLDWMMSEAARRGIKVLLVVGQKQPRWPECYIPEWAKALPMEDRRKALLAYVKQTVDRYRHHAALELWQVENEPFIGFDFGECRLFDSGAVAEEISLLRAEDPIHLAVVTDSGELSLWRAAAKAADIFGTTVYRTVLTPGRWRFTYDWMPPAVYRLKAWLWHIPYERFFIAELQAEPWLRTGDPRQESISEQERTFNIGRFEKTLDYARRIGASRGYLWGAEWWYWMKKEQHDPRYWEMVKAAIVKSKGETRALKSMY